jgi:plastocyanin
LQRSTDFKFSANPQKGGCKNMKKIISLVVLAAVIGGLVIAGPSEYAVTAQQAQPIPSANDDVRAVAGLLLAQELLNIASTTAVTPSGMLKLTAAPIQGWGAVGGTGLTSQARAAASSSGLASAEVLLAPATQEFQVAGPTAAFVVIATDRAAVNYQVGSTTGTVAAGQPAEVAVQPGQTVQVTAQGDTKVTLSFLDKDKKEISKVEKALRGGESLSVVPADKIKNPLLQRAGAAQNNMLKSVYWAMTIAEGAGQMELAYALASIFLTNGLAFFNFFDRGGNIGFQRIDDCLAGKDITLAFPDPVECSKYKALRAVVATQIAPGAFSFFGPLVGIECPELLQRATDPQATSGARLAAARAYVQGVQAFAGVFRPCIETAEGQSEVDAFLAAAQQAKANNQKELLQEIVGLDYQLYNDADGAPIEIYSSFASRRGLAKALEGAPTDQLEALAQDANNPEIGLAAYYELGNRWADKPEAQLRQLMTDGATPAVRRAATKALLIQLGRAFDVQCLQSLANGQECK